MRRWQHYVCLTLSLWYVSQVPPYRMADLSRWQAVILILEFCLKLSHWTKAYIQVSMQLVAISKWSCSHALKIYHFQYLSMITSNKNDYQTLECERFLSQFRNHTTRKNIAFGYTMIINSTHSGFFNYSLWLRANYWWYNLKGFSNFSQLLTHKLQILWNI